MIRRRLSAIHVIKLNHLELIIRSWAQIWNKPYVVLQQEQLLKAPSAKPSDPLSCVSSSIARRTDEMLLCLSPEQHPSHRQRQTDDAEAPCSLNAPPVSITLTFPAPWSSNQICLLSPPSPPPPAFLRHWWTGQSLRWQSSPPVPGLRGVGFDR